jgi:hypothetical protein
MPQSSTVRVAAAMGGLGVVARSLSKSEPNTLFYNLFAASASERYSQPYSQMRLGTVTQATNRLFEKGYAIHEVAQFMLHDSWATLKRYANLRAQDVPDR